MKAAYNAVATRRKRKLAHTMVTDCSMKGQVAMQRALESANAVAGPGLTPRQELETCLPPICPCVGCGAFHGCQPPTVRPQCASLRCVLASRSSVHAAGEFGGQVQGVPWPILNPFLISPQVAPQPFVSGNYFATHPGKNATRNYFQNLGTDRPHPSALPNDSGAFRIRVVQDGPGWRMASPAPSDRKKFSGPHPAPKASQGDPCEGCGGIRNMFFVWFGYNFTFDVYEWSCRLVICFRGTVVNHSGSDTRVF